MREFHTETSTFTGNMEMLNLDWGSGKLPSFKLDYYDFEGWYTDAECTQAITEYPATDSENFSYPFAKFVRKPVFYATQNGDGNKKGLAADNPMELAEAFTALAQFSRETNKVPTLVLLDDVYLNGAAVVWSVNIIGAKNGVDNEPVTVTGAGNDCVVPFDAGISCTVKNLIIKNGSAATGIKNAGNLTFENCVFNPDSQALAIENTGSLTLTNCQISSTSGAQGIKNTGSLKMTDCSISGCGTNTTLGGGIYTTQPITLINTSITGCNGSYGKMIYCKKEEGGNPTVNGIGAEFEGDFYFDGSISESTQYDASTFPASATAAGVFYATQNGAGDMDGRNVDNAIPINTALVQSSSSPVYQYANTTGNIPTLYVVGDIELSDTYTPQKGVNFIGVLGTSNSSEDDRPKVTSTGTGIFSFAYDATYTVKNFYLDGNNTKNGININDRVSEITIKNCYFNKCAEGVDTKAKKTVIEDCIFDTCKQTSGSAPLMIQGKQTEITRCQFKNCTSTNTGALFYIANKNDSLKITDCSFDYCQAINTSNAGGALYLSGPTTIERITITNCTAATGKGNSIYVVQTSTTAINGVAVTKNMWINANVSPDSDLSLTNTDLWLSN
ncbi:MAG: right-handed parallel beta-helix repeat-containing protein [Treponema sp.]|nr:right-handed parallel beta-helix repeat-containing protein [Candidatus Treponema caballi]